MQGGQGPVGKARDCASLSGRPCGRGGEGEEEGEVGLRGEGGVRKWEGPCMLRGGLVCKGGAGVRERGCRGRGRELHRVLSWTQCMSAGPGPWRGGTFLACTHQVLDQDVELHRKS